MSLTNQTNIIKKFSTNFRRMAGCPEKQEDHKFFEDYYEQQKLLREVAVIDWVIRLTILAIVFLTVWLFAIKSHAEIAPDYYIENERIVEAIYKAEGGTRAKKPFGVLSVPCHSYQECRQICLNTVRNNKKRYADYGHKTYGSFIEFLASRYAPVGVSNDPKGLNRHWIKNVRGLL